MFRSSRSAELGASGGIARRSHSGRLADERHPYQLLLFLAGTLLDSDDAHLLRARAEPLGKSLLGAMNSEMVRGGLLCSPFNLTRVPHAGTLPSEPFDV